MLVSKICYSYLNLKCCVVCPEVTILHPLNLKVCDVLGLQLLTKTKNTIPDSSLLNILYSTRWSHIVVWRVLWRSSKSYFTSVVGPKVWFNRRDKNIIIPFGCALSDKITIRWTLRQGAAIGSGSATKKWLSCDGRLAAKSMIYHRLCSLLWWAWLYSYALTCM